MTESRKIQLETVVDNSGAKQGFEAIKTDARDMAQAVSQAGQQASQGLGKIGDGAQPASQKVDAATRSIIQSIQRATATMQAGAKGSAEFYEALARTRGVDVSALTEYTSELRKVTEAQRQAAEAAKADAFVANIRSQAEAIGKTRSQLLEMQAAQLGVADKIAPYIAKIREGEKGQVALGNATKLTAFQTQQLSFQLHDFVVQVASGQNALTAFVQQGSQLSGTFGGTKGAIQAVLSLLTPFRLAMLAAAAGVGVFALELIHAEEGLQRINRLQGQLAGTGRSGLFSDTELKDFIKDLSQAQGVTREVATSIVSELAKAHDIGGALFKDLSKLAVDYAKATGTTIPAAASALAKAFSDPAQGAKELDKALGTLTSTQILAIEKLTRQGDMLGAQRVLYDALAKSVKGLADNGATPLQKAVNDLGNAWDRAMDTLDHSEGLRTVNALLATAIGSVQWLIDHSPQVGGIGNLALPSVPGLAPQAAGAAVAAAAGSSVTGAIGALRTPDLSRREASGKVGDVTQSAALAENQAGGVPGLEDRRKRALELASAYKSEALQIEELTDKRKALNAQIREEAALGAKSNPDLVARLKAGVAGIDEQIKSLRKRQNAESQSIIDAKLQDQIKATQDALARERDTIAFQQRFLAGQYQAGESSLVDFFEGKRKAIADGTAAEIAALEKERADIQAHLAKTVDPGKRQKDIEQLKPGGEIDRKEADLRAKADRETQLANQEQTASFKQLKDQVLDYRAALLEMAGDEAGAARLRLELAARQDKELQAKAAKSGIAVSDDDLRKAEQLRNQALLLNEAKRETSIVNQALQLEEQRIADAQRRGAISSTDALSQVGEARRRVVSQLEEIVKAQEEVARSRPEDYQLQIDTARARQELERFKTEALDPLAEHFRSLFTDATGNLFADLANNPRNAKEAFKRFATNITGQLNAEFGKDIANQLFGKDGPLGKLPGAFGDLFKKNAPAAQKPLVDTAPLSGSLNALKTAGIDPTVAAFANLQAAIDGTTAKLGGSPATAPANPTTGDFARLDRGQEPAPEVTTGDFTRLDRGQTSGEQQVMDLFKDAKRSSESLAVSTDSAAETVVKLAGAAAKGNDALSLLPYIIRLIQQAAASSGGEVGGYAKAVGSLIGGNTSGAQAAFSQTSLGSSGAGTGLAYGNLDYGLFLHDGGVVGQTNDFRPIPADIFSDAPRYHTGGVVTPEEPLRQAGALKANEVPAILMGGPKGVREEVLTADDPRHSDNLNPKLKHLIDRMPRFHEGGVVGSRINYVAPAAKPMQAPDEMGESYDNSWRGGKSTLIVQVQQMPGASRETAMQQGKHIGLGINRSLSQHRK